MSLSRQTIPSTMPAGSSISAALICAALLAGCKDKKAEPAAAPGAPATPAASASGAAGGAAASAPPQGSTAAAAQDAGAEADGAGGAAGSAATPRDAAAAHDDPSAPDRQPERLFKDIAEPNLADDDPRRKRLEAALTEALSMPVAVLLPIGIADEVYALYQYPLAERCAADKDQRPSTCPPADALALNPECHGFGLVRATFADAQKPPDIVHSELDSTGCDLKVRHWFVADRDEKRKDVVLELVTSYVAERAPAEDGSGRPHDTLHRQQFLALWTPSIDASIGWFTRDLAEWTAEPSRTPEPPVRDAFLLHDLGPYPQLAVIHLLPCLDPTSAVACATELRKRKVYRYGLTY